MRSIGNLRHCASIGISNVTAGPTWSSHMNARSSKRSTDGKKKGGPEGRLSPFSRTLKALRLNDVRLRGEKPCLEGSRLRVHESTTRAYSRETGFSLPNTP